MKYHVWIDSPKELVRVDVEASTNDQAIERAFLRLADSRGNTKGFKTLQVHPEPKSNSKWVKLQEART